MQFTLTVLAMAMYCVVGWANLSAAAAVSEQQIATAKTAVLNGVEINFPNDALHVRNKRATCDLLSAAKLGLNHSACAAHCLVLGKGFRGGYCNGKGVCVCRK